jgi:hypothetical protein
MQMRVMAPLAVVLLGGGCGSSTEPATQPLPTPGYSFSFSAKGDVTSSLTGIPLSVLSPAGYGESTNGGPVQTTSVVLIS